MSDAVLEVRVRAVRAAFTLDMAFRAPPGITALLGPSGAGKSTLLAVLAGLHPPVAGRVALGGDVWFDAEQGIDTPTERRRIGMVFQSLALFPHLTVAENVGFGVDRSLAAAARVAHAHAWLARMHCDHLAARRPSALSGGEQRRVALARAFAAAPRLLLLDEPFAGLDAALRDAIAAEICSAVDALSVPCLLVTHEPSVARAVAPRAARVRDGRVEAVGPSSEVLAVDA